MSDRPPTPAERLEHLTSLYERQAYLAWNVSLRTALDHRGALEAARRAFLQQVESPDESRLAAETARLAAELSEPVDPRSLDDPVLAASARLAPAQRCVLALGTLAGDARAFGLDESAEQEVRRRALEQLATLLDLPAADAEDAYADLPWEEPPAELWHALYPELHAAVTKHARAAQAEAAAPQPDPARRRSWTVPRIPRAALVPVALLAIAGVAWAASGGGSASTSSGTPGDPASLAPIAGGSGGGSSYSSEPEESGGSAPALTAEELDRLRQEEIEDLKRFTARKEDRSLPPRERRQAARKVNDLVKLAQARQQAAERRELALRRQLARERAARMRAEARRREAREEQEKQEERVATPAPQPPPEEPQSDKPQPRDKRDDDKPAQDDQAECLYDEGSGQYICPE